MGLSADHLLKLLDMVATGSLTDERQIGFVAWGFDHVPRDPDPQEVLRVKRVPFAEALDLAMNGTIRDAGSVALLATVQVRAAAGTLPPDLLGRLR